MIDLYLPPKPAIIRASELPSSLLDQRGIELVRNYADRHGVLFSEAAQIIFVKKRKATAATVTYRDTTGDAANQTSYTFTGRAIGDAAADRYVIVCYALQQSGGGAPVDPTITVGGAACTSLITVTDTVAERYGIHITSSPFTTGTTADIVVNEGSTQHGCEIYVFSVVGLLSITPTDTASSTASPPSDTINCNAGGIIVAVAGTAVDASSFSWAGLTERADTSVADTFTASAAGDNFATAQSGLTITATPASSTRPHMAAVALR